MTKSAGNAWLEVLIASPDLQAHARKSLNARTAKPDGDDGCWLFTGSLAPRGYGTLHMRRTKLPDGRVSSGNLAHRVAYVLANMVLPEGGHVLHRCDNRCCVNPDHLFAGTNADNMRDMKAKGRGVPPPRNYGEDHARHHYTREQALAVIALTAAGKKRGTIVAELGVTSNFVYQVRSGRTWGHVTGRVYSPSKRTREGIPEGIKSA